MENLNENLNQDLQAEETTFEEVKKTPKPKKVKEVKINKTFYLKNDPVKKLKELSVALGKSESQIITDLIFARYDERLAELNGEKVKKEMIDNTLQSFASYQELTVRLMDLQEEVNQLKAMKSPSVENQDSEIVAKLYEDFSLLNESVSLIHNYLGAKHYRENLTRDNRSLEEQANFTKARSVESSIVGEPAGSKFLLKRKD